MSTVEQITYRSWEDCYRLSNRTVEVIINASAGGRIMAYSRNGQNIIFEDPRQDGKLLEDYERERFDPDGGRFDYGPEKLTQPIHKQSYMGKWTGEIIDKFTLKITSLPDTGLGIQSIRIFRLDPESSHLKVTQTMANTSDTEKEYFFWGRTLVPVGGKLFIPVNPLSRYPDQWGRYKFGDPVQFESDPGDPGVRIEDGIFTLTPSLARNRKYGVDSEDGWMAYGFNGLIFLKKYEYFKGAVYGENFGQTNIFYTNKDFFAEMEPVSPMVKLNPGEEYSYEEDWYLIEYEDSKNMGFDVAKAVDFLLTDDYL